MAAKAFKRMASAYKAIGLATSGELVATRIKSAQKAFDDVDEASVPLLVRIALGLSKPEETAPFVSHFSEDDAAFDPQPGDREVQGLAGVVLWELIESGKALGATAALVTSTASFGGLRSYIDGELKGFADQSLSEKQAAARSAPPAKITYQTKPKLKGDFDVIDQRIATNQFLASYPNLKNILEGGINYTETGLKDLATQMVTLLDNQRRLDEEMSIHWWIVGGWSLEKGAAFSSLSLDETISRSSKELASMTDSSLGSRSAPGMLDVVLKAGRPELKGVAVEDIATAGSVEWRKSWSSEALGAATWGALVPLTFAAGCASDASDADDWKPRFTRIAAIDPAQQLNPADAALQLYKEHLVIRTLA